jgi:predicted metal-dependent enzyme (double-stranded beta helix superfamily)
MEQVRRMESQGQLDRLIAPIERAIQDDRVTGLARLMVELEADGVFAASDLFSEANPEHYCRRLIWRDPDDRFVIVGMTWTPGQASPLHDHAGLWGVEIVVDGTMHETAFRLVEQNADGRYRFRRESDGLASPSSVGILLPPLEYHEVRNVGPTTAHTVHVYGGALDHCRRFMADDDGWWRSERISLVYDA